MEKIANFSYCLQKSVGKVLKTGTVFLKKNGKFSYFKYFIIIILL